MAYTALRMFFIIILSLCCGNHTQHTCRLQAIRSRTSAIEFIDKMSTFPAVQPTQVVPQHLLAPFKKEVAVRLSLSRVEMVEKLMLRIGEPCCMQLPVVCCHAELFTLTCSVLFRLCRVFIPKIFVKSIAKVFKEI